MLRADSLRLGTNAIRPGGRLSASGPRARLTVAFAHHEVLFHRTGDFYELFYEAARRAAARRSPRIHFAPTLARVRLPRDQAHRFPRGSEISKRIQSAVLLHPITAKVASNALHC